jgi:hypothetical protein
MFYLQRNLPWWERVLRVSLGALVAIAAVVFHTSGVMLWLAIAVAAILAFTGVAGFCPACAMFGRRLIRKAP